MAKAIVAKKEKGLTDNTELLLQTIKEDFADGITVNQAKELGYNVSHLTSLARNNLVEVSEIEVDVMVKKTVKLYKVAPTAVEGE